MKHYKRKYLVIILFILFSFACKNPAAEPDKFTALAIYLDKCQEGESGNPVKLKIVLDSEKDWEGLMLTIAYKGKYVDLDLSNSSGPLEFKLGSYPKGFSLITKLILPAFSESIVPSAAYNTEIDNFRYLKEVSGASIRSIGEYVFINSISLEKAVFPELEIIEKFAFENCSSLTEIDLPHVTYIGESAFKDCTDLASVALPKSLLQIGDSAFRNCISLPSINIPNNVTSIGNYTFYLCNKLNSVTFSSTININNFSTNFAFNGDLRTKYLAVNGGPGTYTTRNPSSTSAIWSKQE